MTDILDSDSLKALSIDTRKEIMKLLAKRPYTQSELSKILNKHVTTISEHMEILEKSGLVRRRESENKWVYYVLADKGERLFKPRLYSWIVVFSLSIVSMFIGFQQIFSSGLSAGAFKQAQEVSAPLVAPATTPSTTPTTIIFGTEMIFGILFISLAMLGFGYIIGRKIRK